MGTKIYHTFWKLHLTTHLCNRNQTTIHHPNWTPITYSALADQTMFALASCAEKARPVKVDGEPPPKGWRFVRGNDKPRLMGVASHVLSRWYISMMTENPQGIMHLRWCKNSVINSSRDSSDSSHWFCDLSSQAIKFRVWSGSFRPNKFLVTKTLLYLFQI